MSVKIDSQARVYYQGDNITLTADDLEWIKSPPKTLHPSEQRRPVRVLRLILSADREAAR
jgi:hypothetical protein